MAGSSRAFAVGLALALGWVAFSAWVHRHHVVDDAFISLRYARNLLSGHGLSFNPGEVVEGVTNVGWVLVVAGMGAAAPVSLPVVAKVLGVASLLGVVVMVGLVGRGLAASAVESAVLPLLVVSSPELVYFSLAGMETGLAALLVVCGAWAATRGRPRPMAAATFCAALFTVRPEAVVVFPLFVGMLLLPGGPGVSRRRVSMALGLFLTLVAAVTAARLAYFGDLLPNTAVAKGPDGWGELARRAWEVLVGRSVNVPAPFVGSMLLLLGGIGVVSLWRRRPAAAFLGAATATGFLFAAYAPPDWTEMGRYFAPYLPAAAVLVTRGAFAGLARVPRLPGSTAAGAAAVLVLLLSGVGLWRGWQHLSPRALGDYPGFVLSSEPLVPAGRWIDRELPPETRIAARRIGALGYFGRRPVLDYAFGLTDPAVAHAQALRGRPFDRPGHPGLEAVWTAWLPGCVLDDEEVLAPLGAGRPRGGPIEVHGLRYREVRRFGLGSGGTEWILACRPGLAGVNPTTR